VPVRSLFNLTGRERSPSRKPLESQLMNPPDFSVPAHPPTIHPPPPPKTPYLFPTVRHAGCTYDSFATLSGRLRLFSLFRDFFPSWRHPPSPPSLHDMNNTTSPPHSWDEICHLLRLLPFFVAPLLPPFICFFNGPALYTLERMLPIDISEMPLGTSSLRVHLPCRFCSSALICRTAFLSRWNDPFFFPFWPPVQAKRPRVFFQ